MNASIKNGGGSGMKKRRKWKVSSFCGSARQRGREGEQKMKKLGQKHICGKTIRWGGGDLQEDFSTQLEYSECVMFVIVGRQKFEE